MQKFRKVKTEYRRNHTISHLSKSLGKKGKIRNLKIVDKKIK